MLVIMLALYGQAYSTLLYTCSTHALHMFYTYSIVCTCSTHDLHMFYTCFYLFRLDGTNSQQVESLLGQLVTSDLSRPLHALQALQVLQYLSSSHTHTLTLIHHTLPLLTTHLIPHPLTPIARKACEIALQLVRGETYSTVQYSRVQLQ